MNKKDQQEKIEELCQKIKEGARLHHELGAIYFARGEKKATPTGWESQETAEEYTKAYEHYMKAAEEGIMDAQFMLGYMEKDTFIRFEEPYICTDAEYWFKQAAEQGDARAQFEMGECHREKAPHEALEWYEKAAEQGHKEAKTIVKEALKSKCIDCYFEKKY